ncbi:DUF3592 domain-containing protein [Promicromonospora sp. NPDC023805]|uniref:DUF3592 domain-containing protein n=1 Tax=Promicromonospora sp. NPDC023805 TaxID=3154696 RepID=UPI00340DAAAE
MCILVAFAMAAAVVTFSLVRNEMILENRGVQVTAEVVDYTTPRRGSGTVTVRSLEPPFYFETDLDRWPRGLGVGQQIDVVFDPHDPGHAVAAGTPPEISVILGVAAFDLFGLACLLAALLPAGELVRRVFARARGHRAPSNSAPTDRATSDEHRPESQPPRGRRKSPLSGLEPGQVVFLLVAAPVSAVLAGMFAANVAGDAAVLREFGVHARATVERSSWGAGGHWLDVRFSPPDGSVVRTGVTPRDRVYYEGETLDVVYQADAPRNAQVPGDSGWPAQAQFALAVFIVCAAGSAVAVPVAVIDLVQRSRRARAAPTGSPTAG